MRAASVLAALLLTVAATPSVADLKPGCKMEVSEEARIIAYGAYEGGVASQLELVGNRGHDTTEVAVRLETSGGPVVLVLTAYDPVVWVLDPAVVSDIRGIIVMGYHSQGVANAPDDIPIVMSTYVDRADGCGVYAYAYKENSEFNRLDASVRRMTGRGIESFEGKYRATAFPLNTSAQPHPAIKGRPVATAEIVMPGGFFSRLIAGIASWATGGRAR